MSAKLENATTQVHDLEKKYEDILLKVNDYENRIHTLCTEVQESQKEVNRLTDDLSKKVRLSLEHYHKFKIPLKCVLYVEKILQLQKTKGFGTYSVQHRIFLSFSFSLSFHFFFFFPSILSSVFFLSPFLYKTFS